MHPELSVFRHRFLGERTCHRLDLNSRYLTPIPRLIALPLHTGTRRKLTLVVLDSKGEPAYDAVLESLQFLPSVLRLEGQCGVVEFHSPGTRAKPAD